MFDFVIDLILLSIVIAFLLTIVWEIAFSIDQRNDRNDR